MIPSASLSKRLLRQRKFRQLLGVLFLISLILGLLVVPIERQLKTSEIQTSFDGLYWAVTTVTTVGYGDVVPQTVIGKSIAIVLQLVGTVMYGIIIAMIGSYINRSQDEFYWNRIFERIDRIEEELTQLKKSSQYLVRDSQEDRSEES